MVALGIKTLGISQVTDQQMTINARKGKLTEWEVWWTILSENRRGADATLRDCGRVLSARRDLTDEPVTVISQGEQYGELDMADKYRKRERGR